MKLSIIVVTWNNENFIEQAIKSCIDPEASEYEVLIVHNASTDRTGELIQRAIAGHKQLFTVIENDKNEGLGEARNIGMSHAKGTYFAFLDGDDWFEPGAVSKILGELDTFSPELLIYNHQRVWDNSDTRPNAKTQLLKIGDATSPHERKKILANFGVAWNKVYHKDLVRRSNATFSKRLYEDIDWNFTCLLHAKTIRTIPDILVNYRQRSGSILRSSDIRHIDAVLQHRSVFEMLMRDDILMDTYGEDIYRYCRSQLFHVFDTGNRIPKKYESYFLKESSFLLKNWRNEIEFSGRDLKLWASQFGSPSLYRIVRQAGKFRSRVRRNLKRGFSQKLSKRINLIIYKYFFLRLPIRKRRVYCESFWGARIDCNPRSIADALISQDNYDVFFGLKFIQKSNDEKYKVVKIESLKYFYILATAEYIVSNANISGHIRKRPGSTHLQTFHGTPWKSMGLDIKKFNPKEMNWKAFARRSRRWDYAISSNPYSSAVWRRSHPFDYKVLEIGYPRNDVFYCNPQQTASKVRRIFEIPKNKKIALYAPTFREATKGKSAELHSSYLDLGEISKALGNDYVLFVRTHYFNKKSSTDNSLVDASEYPYTNELLTSVDLLITDYSSLMFDFANTGKPIVIYAYDYEDYIQNRGSYFDLRANTPGPIAFNQMELIDILQKRSFDAAENRENLANFKREFCPWDDGRATARVLSEVFKIPSNNST